jgi:small GTP-binding protein
MTFKVVLFGPAGVGKTSIYNVFLGNEFQSDPYPTIAPTHSTQLVETDSGPALIELLDTAGQERFLSLTPFYFRGADAILLVVDCSDPSYLTQLDAHLSRYESSFEQPLRLLAVNKIDLVSEFETADLENFCRPRDLPFYLVSARLRIGIDDLFRGLGRGLMTRKGVALNASGDFEPLTEERQDTWGCC